MPRVGEMCDELAGYGLPETIQHDDFHDGQVFVRDGRYLLLDWGDACVSHPFFTLSVTLEGYIAWGLDDIQGLGRHDAVPRRVPGAVRALGRRRRARGRLRDRNAARLGLPRRQRPPRAGRSPPQTRVRLRMFLDGHP